MARVCLSTVGSAVRSQKLTFLFSSHAKHSILLLSLLSRDGGITVGSGIERTMKKITMSPVGVSSSQRGLLRRRHTDDDRIRNLSKNITRKRSIRRSLSRKFSTLSSSKKIIDSEDVLPDVTAMSEVSLTSIEESISTTGGSAIESLLLSSTHVDIQDHGHWYNNKGRHPDCIDENIDSEEAEEERNDRCDDFVSKFLEFMPCSPQHNKSVEQPQNKQIETQETEDDDFDERMMTKIECILKDTLAEGESATTDEEYVPPLTTTSSSLLNENENTLAQPPPLDEWIQDPLLLVATPGSNMIVHRIRRVSEPSYFVSHGSQANNLQCIGKEADTLDKNRNNQLIQLPINNGKERDSFVIDFETDIFAGTALFRIRNSNAWKSQNSRAEEEDNNKNKKSFDYFGSHNRKFQMVIRGRFKSNETVMADCMSGLLLEHPLVTSSSPNINMDCSDLFGQETSDKQRKRVRRIKRGKSSSTNDSTLPPKWALRAAVKVAGVFSPRVDADLECAHPRILTPLCSTAQTITVSRRDGGDVTSSRLDEVHAEPYYESDASLVYDLCSLSPSSKPISSTSNDVQRRKRYCDAAYNARIESMANCTTASQSSNISSPCFDPDAEYTFEFLQHLIDYNDLSLDLGRVIGKVNMGAAFKGQPVRFISAAVKQQKGDITELTLNDLDCIWSFDLYHKSLLPS